MQQQLKQLFTLIFSASCFLTSTLHAVEPTLKQKIGQMIMVGFAGKTLTADLPVIKAIKAGQVGGVILFDYDFKTKTFDHNIENPRQLKALTETLQNAAKVPLLIGIDYEGGRVNRLKEKYGFPPAASAAEMAAAGDDALKQQAAQMADTMRKAGINLDFAPVTDVNINPENPVIGKLDRSFSQNPTAVSHLAGLFSEKLTAGHILCAYKHFPGHGSSTGDSHLGFVDVTHTWQASELIPYRDLLNQPGSCSLVMIAHVVHEGLDSTGRPASLSRAMITGVLRNQLHFKGVVITDDLQMKAITDHYGTQQAVRLAINAGVDILIFGNQLVTTPEDPAILVDMIYSDVLSGKISRQQIEASWQRIMQLKKQLSKRDSASA